MWKFPSSVLVAATILAVAPVREAAAEPPASALLPAKPFRITTPPAAFADGLFEAIATSKGFLVSFWRAKTDGSEYGYYTQRYTAAGKAIGSPVAIEKSAGGTVEMARTGSDRAVAVWAGGGRIKAARLDLATGKVAGVKDIGNSDDWIHEVAVLANGNIAVVSPRIVPLPLPMHYQTRLKILSPSLGTVKDWASVNGKGDVYGVGTGGAYIDQTVVAKRGGGGVVIWRDQTKNVYRVRSFSSSGTLGKTYVLNTTAMKPFFATDIPFLEAKAALLTDGKIAACWVHINNAPGDGSRYDVRCRILSASGVPAGKDFLVSASAAGTQTNPDVVALPGGKFAVTWIYPSAIFLNQVRYRTYSSAGTALRKETVGVDMKETTDWTLVPPDVESIRLADGSIANVIGESTFIRGLRAGGIPKP